MQWIIKLKAIPNIIPGSQSINVSSCYNFPIILVGMSQNVAQLINMYI